MIVIQKKCKKCLQCIGLCPVGAINKEYAKLDDGTLDKKNEMVVINKDMCIVCGACASVCPNKAIEYD